MSERPEGLKEKVIRGGLFLTLRKLVAAAFSLVSVLLIARVLGPEKYGIVAIALGTFYFFKWICKLGLNVYLIRQTDISRDSAEQVLAFFTTVGFLLCCLLFLSAPAFGWWTERTEITQVIRWLTLPVWFEMLASASVGMMERELRFAEVGLIETAAQITNYAVAIPIVLIYQTVWGPIIGVIAQFGLLLGLARWLSPVSWGWRWKMKTLKPALHYGLTYSGSDLILSLRALTVPMLVSRLAGIEAAGLVSISVRFVEQLAMLRIVVRRMSISVIAKFLDSPDRIRRTISQGMAYQILLVGPFCALFSCLALWLVPLMFGERWLPSARLFPLVALAIIVATLFDLHSGALYAIGKNNKVAQFNAVYIGLLWLGCGLLIPRYGIWGYGIAEILSLPSYGLMHIFFSQTFGSPNYRLGIGFLLATLPALLGGIVLPLGLSVLLFVVSYGGLLIASKQSWEVIQKLWLNWKSRPSPS
ncbi:MAG: oligosaccharide flippase family protein [Elainellaceae cyanobacterium]